MLRSIAYVSRATRRFVPEELDALLVDARTFNASVAVTGVLFLHDRRFFQYIEGPDDGIARAYARIRRSRSHDGMETLLETAMPRRYFDARHMGFCEPPGSALQRLANASWEQAMPITRDEVEGFEGLSLVAYYWNKWSAERQRGGAHAPP
jgi:hypothetical protein